MAEANKKNRVSGETTQTTQSRKQYVLYGVIGLLVVLLLTLNYQTIRGLFGSSEESEMMTGGFINGQQVSFSGVISKELDLSTIQHFTHVLETEQYGKVGLSSRVVNMDIFDGRVIVDGTVSESYNGTLVIDVQSIIDDVDLGSGEDLSGANLSGQEAVLPNFDFVSEGGIAFDKDILTGYKISYKNGTIKILDQQGKLALTIGYFQCKQDKSSEDCINLTKNIKAAGPSNIDSSNGKKFYKLAETTNRFVSNNDLRGYYFTPANEQTLNSINQGIRFIDDQFIQEYYAQQLKSACKNGSITLDTIETASLTFQGLQLVTQIVGQDAQGTGVECKLQLSISDEPRFSLLLLVSKKAPSTETTDDQSSSSAQPATDPKQASTGTPFKINTGSTLDFTSRRGFSISYPSKGIAFESTNIKSDLGIKGLSCYSQTNIVAFKDQDSVNENPQVVVYECTTKFTQKSSEIAGFIYQESDNGLKFLIKTNNADRDNFAKNIIIK